jgi:serine/threonine protein kinase
LPPKYLGLLFSGFMNATRVSPSTFLLSGRPALGKCQDANSFERLEVIGDGTFGVVYKARHRETGEVVAMKRVLLHNEVSHL